MKIYLSKIFLFILLFIFNLNYSVAQVYINQAGYLNNLPKYFFSSSNADSFYVIESSTGINFYSGPLNLYKSNDPATGLTLYRGDFSSLQRDGIYFIRTNNQDSSFNFRISTDAFSDAYAKSLKGYYFQRCGAALLQVNAGAYYHSACHTGDGFYHSSTGQSGFHLATGGWHDAGDYGKYVVNAGITVGTLLMAYEMFPQKFDQDNLNIPESGNGISDLLDEVRYELEWLIKMQNSNGGVYFKVTKEQFESIVLPNNDSGTRYIYVISSTATGDFAAIMARAGRIFKSIDTSFSNKCLNASLLAWNYLTSNPTIIPAGGFKNPTGTVTGEYGDANDSDERLWAAAELFSTTGDATFKSYFESRYTSGGIINSTMGWPNVKDLAQLTYLTCNQSSASSTVKTQIKNSLINYCNTLLTRASANGFGITINPGEYYWGSNADVLNKAILLIYAYEQTNNLSYYNTALMQLNYILGTNAHNLSFVTGVGTKSVMHPHHRPSWADGIIAPVPGLLAGGPNQYLDDDILKTNFTSSTPPALCYLDNADSYASNEIAINWNAPLVFVLGFFNGEGLTSIDDQGMNYVPDNFEIDQNYPNPFNPSTVIRFQLPVSSQITLRVYDILGNEVATLVNQEQSAGKYEVEFNPIARMNYLTSGIYFYQIKAGSFIQSKKMIYLK